MTTTAPELDIIVDTDELPLSEEGPRRTRTPAPVAEPEFLVADEKDPRDPTVPYAPRTAYEEGVEDALKFMRASLIWRVNKRITRELAEEVFMDVRLAARDSTPRRG